MYEEDKWQELPAKLAKRIIETIGDAGGKYEKPTKTAQVSQCSLPFYDHSSLIRASDPGWGNDKPALYFLLASEELYPLNGQSIEIHEHNAKESINLTRDNAIEYLRFFGFFVKAKDGQFLVIETVDDHFVPEDISEHARRALEQYLRPAKIVSETEQGSFLCSANILYGNALFASTFEVKQDGTIDILQDEPLAADLQISISSPFL